MCQGCREFARCKFCYGSEGCQRLLQEGREKAVAEENARAGGHLIKKGEV